MATQKIINALSQISILEKSLIVECENGGTYMIDRDDQTFILEQPHDITKNRKFDRIDQVLGYLGSIKSVILLDHDLDEETIIV